MISRRTICAVAFIPVAAQVRSQSAFARFTGSWEGYVDPGLLKLHLMIGQDGRFSLVQTGAHQTASESGTATMKGEAIVVAIAGGDLTLQVRSDGRLAGPYVGSRVRGTATLTRKS